MARSGRCSNFGLCGKADSRDVISGADGGDFSCPECGRPLTVVGGGGGGGGSNRNKLILLLGGGGLAALASLFLLLPPDQTEKPVEENTEMGPGGTVPPHNAGVIPPDGGGSGGPLVPPGGGGGGGPVLPPGGGGGGPVMPPGGGGGGGPVMPPGGGGGGPIIPPDNGGGPIIPPDDGGGGRGTRAAGGSVSGVVRARLMQNLSTATTRKDDIVSLMVENGPYRGGIIRCRVTNSRKPGRVVGRGKSEIAFDFEDITVGGRTTPIEADLREIPNSRGKVNVDEEGRAIGSGVTKKKRGLTAAVGAGIGAAIGGITGGGRGAAIGAGAGAGAGLIASYTIMANGPAIELNAGSVFTIALR